MNFINVIESRESIREYDPAQPINEEVLKKILEAGRVAPSAANRQPWKFLLISSKDMLSKVRKCYTRGEWFSDAPHILVVAGKKSEAWQRADGYNSIETDLTIAMDHMILAAENEGVGTCWIAAFDLEVLKNSLGLEDDETVFAITPLGYQESGFQKKSDKKRKPFDEVVKFL